MRLRVRCAALALWAGVVNAQVPPPLVDYHQHFFSPDLAKLVGVDTIDADKLIRLLDAAGIRRALVLSTAYSWSNPSRNVENNYEHVKADNDWTSATPPWIITARRMSRSCAAYFGPQTTNTWRS